MKNKLFLLLVIVALAAIIVALDHGDAQAFSKAQSRTDEASVLVACRCTCPEGSDYHSRKADGTPYIWASVACTVDTGPPCSTSAYAFARQADTADTNKPWEAFVEDSMVISSQCQEGVGKGGKGLRNIYDSLRVVADFIVEGQDTLVTLDIDGYCGFCDYDDAGLVGCFHVWISEGDIYEGGIPIWYGKVVFLGNDSLDWRDHVVPAFEFAEDTNYFSGEIDDYDCLHVWVNVDDTLMYNGNLEELTVLIYGFVAHGGQADGNHLLISEFCVTPTAGGFIEIYNPTGDTIVLDTLCFITDATSADGGNYYYNIVLQNGTAGAAGQSNYYDFNAHFPPGSEICTGEYQTIAIKNTDFNATYGVDATYELINTDGTPDMIPAEDGSIDDNAGLDSTGEVLILYRWDWNSDLVQDVDYVVWGDKAEAVDKTGICIDGMIDPDTDSTCYLADTDISSQTVVNADNDLDEAPHDYGKSAQRCTPDECNEIPAGGNGITGYDETSEDMTYVGGCWTGNTTPTPGGEAPTIVILAEFTATGYDGYIEIEWTTATEIDNAGFNLHRGLSKERPSTQLNEELIPAQGDELQGASYSFTDCDVNSGVTHYYWLEDVDLHGRSTMHGPVSATPTSVEEREEVPIPTVFSLAQNFPNPFNATTEIKYGLPLESDVSLTIYNLAGQKVATLIDGKQKAGYKIATWDAGSHSSGIYFYRLKAGDFVETRKMVLLK